MPVTTDDRYSRQVLFPGIGKAGQERLRASTVAIVGCGATGSAAASLLARAGIGKLIIIDRDYVEFSNLQRQSLFDEKDAAESLPKALAAAQKIKAFNSEVEVLPFANDLTPANLDLLDGADLILDGTDNFETRFLINDYCVSRGTPWIYSAAVGSYGATMNVIPGKTACLACLFPEAPGGMNETCETAGILGSVIELIASIAVTEAIKILLGDINLAAANLRRTLLSWDVWKNQHSEVKSDTPRAGCRCCGERDFLYLRGERRPRITLCGRNSVQIHEQQRPMDFAALNGALRPHGKVRHTEFVLKFWPEDYEITLFPDGRAIIKGTTDPAIARSLYARFLGN
ncbi:MAG: ThiF family adenylyltransferase [Terriglobales bacterium]|jgi:molybdopterin/thiamine biosynthesis adenylyltransferase